MKTFRLFGKAFLALLMTVNFIACGSSDSEPTIPEYQCSFTIDGKTVYSGDTIHLTDRKASYNIKWENATNITKTEAFYFMDFEGIVNIHSTNYNRMLFYSILPNTCKLKIGCDETGQVFVLYVVFDPMGLDELKKVYKVYSVGGYKDINGVEYKGPFVELHTKEFEFGTERIKIESFGTNYEECYPSNSDHINSTLDGYYYLGKLKETTGTKFYDAEYWFFKFTYGGKTHEIRSYKGQDKCLWDGEWNN